MLAQSKNGVVQSHLPLAEADYSDAGFNDSVRIAARATGGREFTVADIETSLKNAGVKLPAVNPRKRISTMLKEMCSKNMLTVVRRGQGKVPHVYRTA